MFIIVVVVVAAVAVLMVVFIIVVVVMMAVAVLVVVFIFVVAVVRTFERLLFKLIHLFVESIAVLHGGEQFGAGELLPGGGDQRGLCVVRAHQLHRPCELFLAGDVGMGEDYAVGSFDLVVEELAEVLHVHLTLCRVHYCGVGVYFAVL